jgi:hypothetical protein
MFTAAKTLRSINSFTREDGTPLNYTLVYIKNTGVKTPMNSSTSSASTPTTATTVLM